MVNGIEKFKEYFQEHTHQFVLIGGSACDLLFEADGLTFRPTKDFDMVLTVEVLEPGFFKKFWSFILAGKYEVKEHGASRCLYRFSKPKQPDFPSMLELFSRRPEQVHIPPDVLCTPIPAGEEASSLSAILLDDESYSFLNADPLVVQGVRVAGAEKLIGLKALAWVDLKARKEAGEPVDTKNIVKHRRDIYRLSQLLRTGTTFRLPEKFKTALIRWLEEGMARPLNADDPVFAAMSGPEIHALIQALFLN